MIQGKAVFGHAKLAILGEQWIEEVLLQVINKFCQGLLKKASMVKALHQFHPSAIIFKTNRETVLCRALLGTLSVREQHSLLPLSNHYF